MRPTKTKTKRLVVLLHANEKRELEDEARKRGVSLGALVRQRLFEKKEKAR